ncbi:PAS domain-containing sensor histidine kinase [Lutibacter sp. A80]|uniref:PAS domain-containing sensor histidine kinase n=1 Tax=Lutibacter sp. A80 TaxID=2918453 RepID=UPI001F056D09|nr:PAS domain-containing sensor histidine kinase [Lutibacter sp. A80]UMB60871.1 PAS domain-containing sensor histidine kinase [Lutibacter sp. A80]
MLLELVLSSLNESNESTILNKSIPLYLRKLNCFSAGVLKKQDLHFKEILIIPYVYKNSKDWEYVKSYFSNKQKSNYEPCLQLEHNNAVYYAYNLTNYGILILGRKKPFSINLINELNPIVNNLGIKLTQAYEHKQQQIVEKSLIESEQCLRTLLKTTAASILIFHNKRIIYANNSAEQFTGYDFMELVNLDISNLLHPDFKLFYENINTSELKEDKTLSSEVKILKKNHTEKWVNVNINQIKWLGLDAIIISAFDITQLKQTEQDLINAKEEAEKSERLKTAFLANISHEIRTPMSGILGFTELLKTPHLTNEKKEKYISIIEKSGDRMLNLINNIIDISKIEARLMSIKYSEVDVNEQLNNLFNFFNLEATNKGLKFKLNKTLANSPVIIKTDYEKFYAVLTNLIKNSIKYTDTGSIEVGYTIKKETNFIEFYIKDTGIGVPLSRQKAIFERFIQADIDDINATQGAGLGLSISKAFIEMLGGKIWIKSTKNEGSTFYFTLPFNT